MTKTKRICPHQRRGLVTKANGLPIMVDGDFVYEKTSHIVCGVGTVHCTKCDIYWCCVECCIETDCMDLKTYLKVDKLFDRYREKNKPIPEVFDIICCKCSGNKPSWAESH